MLPIDHFCAPVMIRYQGVWHLQHAEEEANQRSVMLLLCKHSGCLHRQPLMPLLIPLSFLQQRHNVRILDLLMPRSEQCAHLGLWHHFQDWLLRGHHEGQAGAVHISVKDAHLRSATNVSRSFKSPAQSMSALLQQNTATLIEQLH